MQTQLHEWCAVTCCNRWLPFAIEQKQSIHLLACLCVRVVASNWSILNIGDHQWRRPHVTSLEVNITRQYKISEMLPIWLLIDKSMMSMRQGLILSCISWNRTQPQQQKMKRITEKKRLNEGERGDTWLCLSLEFNYLVSH